MNNNIQITNRTYCITLPPKIHSKGIGLPGYEKGHVLQYGLPQLELQMVTMFVLTQVCSFIFKPFGFPPIVPQLISGIILGPAILGRSEVIRKMLFPEFNEMGSHAQEISDALEMFGYTMFLFLVGVKMDMSMIRRVGQKCWAIGIIAFIFPLIAGSTVLALYANKSNSKDNDMDQLSMILIEQALTSFPVISVLLSDLKLVNTELGRLALSSSLITNVIGILIVFLISIGGLTKIKMYSHVGMMIGFVVGLVFVFRPALKWVIKRTPEGRPVKEIYLQAVVFLILGSAVFTNNAGQTIILGPFLLGLAVPDGPPLGTALVSRLESFFTGILLPVYVTSTAANANFHSLMMESNKLPLELVMIIFMFFAKVVGSILPPLLCKIPFNDSLTLALILSCRGVVELGTYRYIHGQHLIGERVFALSVITVLLSSAITPLLVRRLFDSSRKYGGYQSRNIMHLKPDMELPLVTCIHTHDDIASSIGLLSCLDPSRDSPLRVNAIHLIKLVGQATPVLISHQRQKRIVGKSYSDNMILAFTNYARNNMGAVHVNLFTAISPPKLMHEDVCHIALDKLASLIILPYHCKWSREEKNVESEDSNIRALNASVLQRAPCSTAILVDRGNLEQAATKPQFRVGVFYIGSPDDQEALVLAKRMARDPGVVLTVVHLCENEEGEGQGMISRLEEVMEDSVLAEVKNKTAGTNVGYKREVAQDGPQAAVVIRSMVEEFDLVMVGRNYRMEWAQTTGLGDWSEVEELGVLGDLLASGDMHTDASILVVQQQKRHI